MKKYSLNGAPGCAPHIVEATQITNATFDDPHPNDDPIQGVLYCPKERHVEIKTFYDATIIGEIGDWIIRSTKGKLAIVNDKTFQEIYRPAELTSS